MRLALLVVAMALCAGCAHAIVYDVWYTTDSAVAANRPSAGWTPSPEQNTPSSWFVLAPNQTVWFAMDNFWYPDKWKDGYFQVSTTTRGFFYDNAVPITGGYGYDPADQPTEPLPSTSTSTWTAVNSSDEDSYTGEVDFKIRPQPSWEWIKMTNPSSRSVMVNSASGWAICTPEPPYGLLLLLGTVPVFFRRRVCPRS